MSGLAVFLMLSVVLGGAAAASAGRALAQSWRPIWQAPLYIAALAAFVRFLHYALFEEPLRSPLLYGLDFVVLLVAALIGFALTRARQRKRQYGWLVASALPERNDTHTSRK